MAKIEEKTNEHGLRHVDCSDGLRVAQVPIDGRAAIWLGLSNQVEQARDFPDASETLVIATSKSDIDELIAALNVAREWVP